MKRVIDELLVEATILGMLEEAMTYDEYLDKSPKITKKGKGGTDQGSSQVSIRTALAYKGQKFKNNQNQVDDSRKDAYAQAVAYLQSGIEQGELKRNKLAADVKDDVLRKSPERPAAADDAAEEPDENPARAGQPPEDSFDDTFGDDTAAGKKVDEPTDTKSQRRVQGNITDESIDAVDGEQKDLALEGKAKAPGNPSSLINEIEIGYGMTMFSDNPDVSVEDVTEELYNRTKDTVMGKRNGEKKTRDACLAAAISAKRENTRVQEFLASEDMNPDTTEISHVWGSQQSLQATVDTLEEDGVEEVNGLPFETYKGIIMAGGAGANPTDTMITMIDSSKTPPKAIILHTSNKTSTADIQSNSSPEKNIEAMINAAKEMEENGDLTPKESNKIIKLAEETRKGLIAKQKEIASIVSSSFANAREQVESGDYVETLKTLSTGSQPDVYWQKLAKRYSNSKNKFAVKVSDPPTPEEEKEIAGAYLKEMEYLATTKDEVAPPTADMNTILARTALTDEDEEKMIELYQEQHEMQNKMRLKMNKTKEGFGDRVMAKTFMSRLHLDVAEGHAPGGIPPQYFELNMGHNKSNIKYDDDGQAYIKEDGKFYPIDVESGDVDKDAEPKKISQLNSGTTATIGNMETLAGALGYKIPPPPENIDEKIRVGSIESAATGPAGKAFIYGINVDDEEVIIGFQSVRPKDGKGTRHQDTIEWAKDFQTRLQLASARQAQQERKEKPNESVSYRHIQTLIEMASKV